jgi:site-specific DNA-methyltransferase (adenine-specific)
MSDGKKEILLGDCLELMKDIPNGSIDMILCDLPYGTTACKWDTIIPFDKLWEQYKRIIKDDGAIVLTASQPFTSALVMSNPKMFKYSWVYQKSKATNFLNAKKNPLKYHEDVLVFGKGLVKYNPQMVKGEPYKKVHRNDNKDDCTYGKSTRKNGDVFINKGERYPSSVIPTISNPSGRGQLHPTQKPTWLFEYLIKTYTNEGELVLDNTAGSGTTAIACLKTNRQFIVMEQEQKYYDIILKRVGDFNKNFEPQTLFGNEM